MASPTNCPNSSTMSSPSSDPGRGAAVALAGDAPVRSLYVHVPFCAHKCE